MKFENFYFNIVIGLGDKNDNLNNRINFEILENN